MWSRAELKARAKDVLRKSYWKALIAAIVIGVATGSNGGSGGSGNTRYTMDTHDLINFPWLIFAGLGFVLFLMLIRFLLLTVLEVGARKYFVEASTKSIFDLSNIGYGFKDNRYINIVLSMLYRGVLLFLWTLLLVIPGIIKYYAYRMVPFILAENPSITPKRAIELSNKMTNGEKMEMFILDVSFIGWYLLGLLALCVGVVFVLPYYETTVTELYVVLRNKAIKEGHTSKGEFNLADSGDADDGFSQYYKSDFDEDDEDDDWT